MTNIKDPEELKQADIQKRLKELHNKLRRLNLPIAAYPTDKDRKTSAYHQVVGETKTAPSKITTTDNNQPVWIDNQGNIIQTGTDTDTSQAIKYQTYTGTNQRRED